MSQVKVQGNVSGTGIFTIESPNSNSNRTLTLPDATGTIATSADLSSLNASNLTSGTVPTARLATGTANSTTYLRGDQTWQSISVTPTTADVLNATAGASVGATGTYALLNRDPPSALGPGSTLAGSALFYSSCEGQQNGSPSGTWRLMGMISSLAGRGNTSVWLRIS